MSMGWGGYAELVLQDETTLLYSYGGFNLNEEKYRNENWIRDGEITVLRAALIEPEIHERIKKRPSGRKVLQTKRIPVTPPYEELIQSGGIVIKNCSNCWKQRENGIDITAWRLIDKLFNEYQETGLVPEKLFIYL